MRPQKLFLLGLVGLAIAGCAVDSKNGSIGKQLGVAQDPPDEFLIIARNPIEVPASFSLPLPQPGAPSRVELDPIGDAHRLLFARPEPMRLAEATEGEMVLLRGADATGDYSGVRAALAEDNADLGEAQFGLTSIFGVNIPNRLEDIKAGLDPIDEEEALRKKLLPTPTAPPPPKNRDTGIRYIEN